MNIKQTSTPLITGLISTATCFSLGFFTNVFKYNGMEFIYAYVAFLILLCYPMNIVAIYIQKTFPELNTHSKLIKQIIGSSILRPFSILLTGAMILLVTIIVLNLSTYILDFFDNIPAVDRLSDTSLKFSNNLPVYTSLIVVFVIVLLTFTLGYKNKLHFNNFIKTVSHISLYLIIILMLIVIYSPHSFQGIEDFLFELNYQSTGQIRHMLALAMTYAILSNFVSIAFYKNIINVVKDDFNNLKLISLKSIFYNIVFTIMICITIYAILGDYRTFMQPTDDLHVTQIFKIVKQNSPAYYLLLEIIYITFNLIVSMTALKYTLEIGNKLFIKLFIIILPFVMTILLIQANITHISFSAMFGLQLVIIFLFLFDTFIIGWIYDAQKLSYEILKNTNTRLSPVFNIMLRIIIPFTCIYIAIGYIFLSMALIWQFVATIVCLLEYIIKGSIFSKVFNKRRF